MAENNGSESGKSEKHPSPLTCGKELPTRKKQRMVIEQKNMNSSMEDKKKRRLRNNSTNCNSAKNSYANTNRNKKKSSKKSKIECLKSEAVKIILQENHLSSSCDSSLLFDQTDESSLKDDAGTDASFDDFGIKDESQYERRRIQSITPDSCSSNPTDNKNRYRVHQIAEDYINLVGSIMYPPSPILNTFGYNPKMNQYPIEHPTALGYLSSPVIRRPSSVIEKWSPYEVATFEASMFLTGKKFDKIQKNIPTKTTKEIIEFYYIWKKTSHYKEWKKQYYEADFDTADEGEDDDNKKQQKENKQKQQLTTTTTTSSGRGRPGRRPGSRNNKTI